MKTKIPRVAFAIATVTLSITQPAVSQDVRETNVVSGPTGPKFSEPAITINIGGTIQWNTNTLPGVPHQLFQVNTDNTSGDDLTGKFTGPAPGKHQFSTAGVFKVRCEFHKPTMIQTVTVQAPDIGDSSKRPK